MAGEGDRGAPRALITPHGYNAVYRRRANLSLIAGLDRRSFGRGFPRAWNTGTYAQASELEELATCLAKPAQARTAVILDLGCGEGSMGRYLAGKLRRCVLGIDFSDTALDLAMQRKRSKQIFALADGHNLPLANASISAAFSWDALYLMRDRAKAIHEAARVMTPAAPLIFTAYIPKAAQRTARRDWDRMLRRAGFELQAWSERTQAWRRHMQQKHARRLLHEKRILKAHGVEAQPDLAVSRSMLGIDGRAPFLSQVHRIRAKAVRL